MAYPLIHQFYHCNSGNAKKVVISDLPRITPCFRYQQAIRLGSHIGSGVLTFHQPDFAKGVSEFISSKGETWLHPFDGQLIRWAEAVDMDAADPCLLPVAWRGIELILINLIEARKFSAFCFDCQRTYEASEMRVIGIEWHGGTGCSGADCPAGHKLFRTEIIHLLIR